MDVLAISAGRTFTEIASLQDGQIRFAKVKTLGGELETVLTAIKKSGVDLTKVDQISIATLLAAKAISEERGALSGLITTRGFRDVLEIRRSHRRADPYNLYNLQQELPKPFVPRRWRKEVTERVDSKGNIIEPLNENEVREVAQQLKKEGVESIAIVFLFSFLNPEHEARAEDIVREEFPGVHITTSSSLAPIIREYERTSTTAANAYTAPLFSKYMTKLSKNLDTSSYRGGFNFMQSNGGLCPIEVAQDKFINTLLSSTAAGVAGTHYLSKTMGEQNILTFDMGGTSSEACFIHEGRSDATHESNFAEQAIGLPMLDIRTVGQGGALIVWVDSGGAIRVGPRSTDAFGPVCYNMGGQEPTLTDADMVLGYINPKSFLGGEMEVDKEAAVHAYKTLLKRAVDIDSVEEAAVIAFDVANATMIGAINEGAMLRGYELSDFSLVAFGGCGPIHASRIAPLLGISKVIVPMNAGTFNAFGLLVADTQYDYINMLSRVKGMDVQYLNAEYEEMEKKGGSTLENEGISKDNRLLKKSIGMRYALETHEVILPLPDGNITTSIIKELEEAFHERHERYYGHKMLEQPVVAANLYLSAIGLIKKPMIPQVQSSVTGSIPVTKVERKVYFPGTGGVVTPIYDRAYLLCGNYIQGPAVIEEKYSTTVVFPGQKAQVDRYGSIIVEV
ncbi:hydantoinase/oxoprolinase family protein [Chloroflexota bacterium]